MARPASTLLVLGATGDLTSRLLLPGMGRLLTEQPERRITLIGAGQQPRKDSWWPETVGSAFKTVDAGGPAVDHALDNARYFTADASSAGDLRQLIEASAGTPVIYFALPPAVTVKAVQALHDVELPEGTVLALEKPFGSDRESAASLNRMVARLVPEEQVFRVDHFMGKSTVLNVLGLRLANRIFEPLWNRDYIDAVEIVYDEELGLEGRAGYYDRTGAMVDMIQSHLLQVLSLVTMEPPASLEPDELHGAKVQALRMVHLWADDPVRASRRARYTEGVARGRSLSSYTDEEGVDPARETETLAELTVEVRNWRWAGVPFTLRSGKAIGQPRKEIRVMFRGVPHLPDALQGIDQPTVLHIYLESGGIRLEVNLNGPGNPFELDRCALTAELGPGRLDPYGEVLQAILDHDLTLSLHAEAAEQSWRLIDQVREVWDQGQVPLEEYGAGSPGPAWNPPVQK